MRRFILIIAFAFTLFAVSNAYAFGSGYLDCNGTTGDHADSASALAWGTLSAVTFEAMVRMDSTTPTWRALWSTVASPSNLCSVIYADRAGGAPWQDYSSFAPTDGDPWVLSPQLTNETSWHRLTVTLSGTTATIYIDGTAGAPVGRSWPETASNGIMRLCEVAYGPDTLDGQIADFRILNVAKDSTWINAHKNCRLKSDTAGLIDYWPLDETSGTTAANQVAGGHGALTLAGTASFSSASPPDLSGTDGSDCYSATPFEFSSSTSEISFAQWDSPQIAANIDLSIPAGADWTLTTDVQASAQGTPPFATMYVCAGDTNTCACVDDSSECAAHPTYPGALSGTGPTTFSIDNRRWNQAPPGVYVITITASCATCTPTTAVHTQTVTITDPPALSPADGTVLAFPGAEGCGKYALGGRGPGGQTPTVYWVTTLSDDTPAPSGSLRECVEASGPRYCLFNVSGTIQLKSILGVTHPYLTIAGQTATGGIQITNDATPPGVSLLTIGTHDVIVRYVRLRSGSGCDQYPYPDPLGSCSSGANSLQFSRGSDWGGGEGYRQIADHVSLSFAPNKNHTAWMVRNTTLQNSILSHPLVDSVMGTPIGYNQLVGAGACFTDYRNYYAHAVDRQPPLIASEFNEVVNNVLWNSVSVYGQLATNYYWIPTLNLIGNVFKRKTGNTQTYFNFVNLDGSGPPDRATLMQGAAYDWDNQVPAGLSVYRAQDVSDGYVQSTTRHSNSPYAVSAILPANAVAASVLSDAGASRALSPSTYKLVDVHDSYDTATIADYTNGTGAPIDNESEASGFPTMGTHTTWTDTDGDGMPDGYEDTHSLNKNDASDAWTDADSDGYTNLEEFLNSAACGNGILETGEQCDDANETSSDGCSDTCQIETSWSCTGGDFSICRRLNGGRSSLLLQ